MSKPVLTLQEKQRIQMIFKQLPAGMKKVGIAAEKAIDRCMQKGYSFETSENMVLEILKESKPYLMQKMYSNVVASIEMIF